MPDFSPQSLLQVLQQYPNVQRYWVAFSGGVDSSVLLHALVQLMPRLQAEETPIEVRAIYIDHGLQAESFHPKGTSSGMLPHSLSAHPKSTSSGMLPHSLSAQWADHCRAVCDEYGIAFVSMNADLLLNKGDSVEEKARESRYLLLASQLEEHDVLLTAQHKDDQAETFLLQALRGAGPKGLASMPEIKAFAKGRHMRPLLGFSKQDLVNYATAEGLSWVEDPSNQQLRFQRNYLRQKILPLLKENWPAASDTLSRSAGYCAESADLLQQLARIDMVTVAGSDNTLSRAALNHLSRQRRANLIRYWLTELALRAPNHQRLEQMISQLETSAQDKSPYIVWPGVEIRCYRDKVYAMAPLVLTDETKVFSLQLRGQTNETLKLDDGELHAYQTNGNGLRIADNTQIEVRFRQGGERCQPAGQAHSRELKTLFQEWAIPHWLRGRIPLIYVEGELAVIAGLCICQPFVASDGELSWQFDWYSD